MRAQPPQFEEKLKPEEARASVRYSFLAWKLHEEERHGILQLSCCLIGTPLGKERSNLQPRDQTENLTRSTNNPWSWWSSRMKRARPQGPEL
ncbi:hypothetical protein GJAV_G00107960 [Gymnothorax javanicus]|nr:hypothetical protein GJAV_G00107960 [Gymnothorax javanicus]